MTGKISWQNIIKQCRTWQKDPSAFNPPPTPLALEGAIALAAKLRTAGFVPVDAVYPTPDRGIMFERLGQWGGSFSIDPQGITRYQAFSSWVKIPFD